MTLSNTSSFVKVRKDLFEPFGTVRAFRQGDPLLCGLSKFIMENFLRKAGVQPNDTIFSKGVQLLCTLVTSTWLSVPSEMLLLLLVLSSESCPSCPCGISDPMADNYTFDVINEIVSLDSAITSKNNISPEIKRRITLANNCFYGLRRELSSRYPSCDEIYDVQEILKEAFTHTNIPQRGCRSQLS